MQFVSTVMWSEMVGKKGLIPRSINKDSFDGALLMLLGIRALSKIER